MPRLDSTSLVCLLRRSLDRSIRFSRSRAHPLSCRFRFAGCRCARNKYTHIARPCPARGRASTGSTQTRAEGRGAAERRKEAPGRQRGRGPPPRRMEKRPLLAGGVLLSHGLHRSTIGARGLNFRVRDGTGCASPAMAAGQQGAFSSPLGSAAVPSGPHSARKRSPPADSTARMPSPRRGRGNE